MRMGSAAAGKPGSNWSDTKISEHKYSSGVFQEILVEDCVPRNKIVN